MFDFATYEKSVCPVELEGVDFGAFFDDPLPPAVLRCLRYMHDVEHHTSCYLRNLLNTRAHADPEISSFLTLWNYEEYWHGKAIGQVLQAHGEPAGDERVAEMRRRLGWKITVSPIAWMAFSTATRHFLAVHMTFGVINEWTTQAAYGLLAKKAGHPVLSELLRRIMRQEGRHIDFYLHQAKDHLGASSGARRTTRAVVRGIWHPVGSLAMPEAETQHLGQTLFADGNGQAVVSRIDRRVDTLPGLEGLRPMSRAMKTYGLPVPSAA